MSTGRDLPRKPLHINGVGILQARCSFSRTKGVKTKKPRAVKHATVVKFWKLLNTNWLPVNTNFWLASVGEPYMLPICSFIPYLFMKNSRPHPPEIHKYFVCKQTFFSAKYAIFRKQCCQSKGQYSMNPNNPSTTTSFKVLPEPQGPIGRCWSPFQ